MNEVIPQGGLQYLIQDHKGDRSYAKLAADCGLLSPTAGRSVHKLAHNSIRSFPDPDTITGLARGLRVTPLEVLKAAAVSVGISVDATPDEDLVIPGGGKLPAEARALVLNMAEQLLDAHSRPWGDDADGFGLAAHKGEPGVDPQH
jgi:hypothetical protein